MTNKENLPFSPASERNKEPILRILKKIVRTEDRFLLEIGSGSGQHAEWMAPHFPNLMWQPTDTLKQLVGLSQRLAQTQRENLLKPIAFEVGQNSIPVSQYDILFTANTFHIMSHEHVRTLIKEASEISRQGSSFVVYGPFRYKNDFLSESNEAFHHNLKERNPLQGIRDFSNIVELFNDCGFRLIKDYSMPANNRLLHFTFL
jgi:cyclopropane fatty-acyl-phospholipid synthase-like methyltransferase